jgi:hypothetical protein
MTTKVFMGDGVAGRPMRCCVGAEPGNRKHAPVTGNTGKDHVVQRRSDELDGPVRLLERDEEVHRANLVGARQLESHSPRRQEGVGLQIKGDTHLGERMLVGGLLLRNDAWRVATISAIASYYPATSQSRNRTTRQHPLRSELVAAGTPRGGTDEFGRGEELDGLESRGVVRPDLRNERCDGRA